MMRILVPILLSFTAIVPTASAADMPDPDAERVESESPAEESDADDFSISEFWQLLPSQIEGQLQEMIAEVTREFDEALVPTGEPQADWETRGFDLIAHMESLPGGIDSNALLTNGAVPSLQFFGKIPANIVAGWDIIQTGSKAVMPSETSAGKFVVISPNHIVFGADDFTRKGHALCTTKAIEKVADHMVIYRYSAVPFDLDNDATIESETEAVMMFNLVGNLGAPVMCSLFDWREDGSMFHLSYTPDGRPLGKMDDHGDRLSIVSSFDLYQQLNRNYEGMFAKVEPGPAEDDSAVDDPL